MPARSPSFPRAELVGLIGLLLTQSVAAQSPTSIPRTLSHNTFNPSPSTPSVLPSLTTARSKMIETTTPHTTATLWALTEDEWNRYEQLMLGIRGAVSVPTISPLEVLGIHARSDAEREHYAQRWAAMMHEDATQILAFQRAYDNAFKSQFPDALVVDTARLSPPHASAAQAAPLMYFLATDCGRCRDDLQALIAAVEAGNLPGIDLYLTDTSSDPLGDIAARRWAQTMALPPALVNRRQITINHANDLLSAVAPTEKAPVLLRAVHGRYQRVALSELIR